MKQYIKFDSSDYDSEHAFSPDELYRASIAEDTDSAELLEIYSFDPDVDVRHAVAANPCTPIEALKRLAADESFHVRWGVACNESTPVELLVKLAKDEDSDVRANVAWNPNTPIEILRKLADEHNTFIFEGLLENPNTPIDILETILMDDSAKRLHEDVLTHPVWIQNYGGEE